MTRNTALALVVAGILAVATGPAQAEHESQLVPDQMLDLDLKLGKDGFDVGGRVFGAYGAWLRGRLADRGIVLDGRVEQPGRSKGFNLDALFPRWRFRTWEIPDVL